MNINMVKLPLIRVAHPSQEDCDREFNKIQSQLQNKPVEKADDFSNAEDFLKDKDNKPPSHYQHTPVLFNFDHHYDGQLTPRKGWQQQVTNLNSLLEQEQEKYRTLQIEKMEEKQKLENELIKLDSKLKEEMERNRCLQTQIN